MPRSTRYIDAHAKDFVGELNMELDEITRRVDSLARERTQTIETTITSAGTEIRHRLGKKPGPPRVTLFAEAKWWEYKPRDATAIYLKSDIASVKAEIVLKG